MFRLMLHIMTACGLLLLMSCNSTKATGSGYLIGDIDNSRVGEPIFRDIQPEYGAVTYIDRETGLIFISANRYTTIGGVRFIKSGPEPYPETFPLQSSGIEAAIKLAECAHKKDCARVEVCEHDFVVRSRDPMEIYKGLQVRAFPVAGLTYIGQGDDIYSIVLSYFTDCSSMRGDLELVVGGGNLLDG